MRPIRCDFLKSEKWGNPVQEKKKRLREEEDERRWGEEDDQRREKMMKWDRSTNIINE